MDKENTGLGSGGHGLPNRLAAAPGSHLHATDPDAQCGRRALLALAHLPGSLLGGRVVAMLPGAHLQVQHARALEVVHHVLQQEELCTQVKGTTAVSAKGASQPVTCRHLTDPHVGFTTLGSLFYKIAYALASVAQW